MDCPQNTPLAKVEAEKVPPPHKDQRHRLVCCSSETSSKYNAAYPRTTSDGVTTDGLNNKDHQDDENKSVYPKISPDVHTADNRST